LLFQLDCSFLHQLGLSFAFKDTASELTFPLASIAVDEETTAVKDVVLPLSFVDCSVGKFIDSLTVVSVGFPLSAVD
jgi:hypothetical protein